MPLIQPASLALKRQAGVISGITAAKVAIGARFAIKPNASSTVGRLLLTVSPITAMPSPSSSRMSPTFNRN
jgi:hypothetical protein